MGGRPPYHPQGCGDSVGGGGVAVLGIDSTGYSSDEFELSFKMSLSG